MFSSFNVLTTCNLDVKSIHSFWEANIMYPHNRFAFLFLTSLAFLMFFTLACSNGSSPVTPDDQAPDFPVAITSSDTRMAIAEYDLFIDPLSQTCSVIPVERTLSAHMNLTQYFPNVFQITAYGFTPTFWADIKLTHPMPGSGVTVYDPRVILLTPAETGVSMYYPVANVLANHSAVIEPDAYTPLYDNVMPSMKGNYNPFKAYFKTCPCREWTSTGVTQETQRWYLNLGGFGGPVNYKILVDVSTAYPAPPQPYVHNAPEPVQISVVTGSGMTDAGGSAPVEVTLLDWQGRTGIGGVVCECPQLFNSVAFLSYFGPGTNPNEYVFKGNISNSKLAAAGDYNMLVGTWDSATMIAICVEVKVTVGTSTPDEPVDVTPEWLNFSPWDAAIDSNIAYIAAGHNGVHIFNVTNMLDPIWINSVDTGGFIERIVYWNGYVYASDTDEGFLEIIDVNPPASASVVNSIPMENLMSVCASGNYLYAAAQDFFYIIDITSPETASIIQTVDPSPYANGVAVKNGYAFAGEAGKFTVIDVDPPSSASVVKTITVPGSLYDIKIYGNYALCAAWQGGVVIVDITDPANPVYYKQVSTSNYIDRLEISGGYAYTSGYNLEILDIEPISAASVVKVVYKVTSLEGLAYNSGYILGADRNFGLAMIDVEPPESAYLAYIKYTSSGAADIDTQGDYAFVACSNGLQVFDITPPESTTWITTVTDTGVGNVEATSGYVYISNGYTIYIADSDPIGSINIINEIGTPNTLIDMDYDNGYLYTALSTPGLSIFDVNPPETAGVVKEVAAAGNPQGIAYWNGYAYIANSYDMFDIYDVNPVGSASRVKQIGPLQSSFDVDVANGIAVVADGSYVRVIDVDPADTAYVVMSIPVSYASSVEISGDYAFIGNQDQFVAVDINPPESASILYEYPMDGYIGRINVNGAYAYICDSSHGMRILKLM